MLSNLQIRNYAIIEEINIDFSGKLSAITGETGAGKSILVGALSLILGERADASALLDRDKKCVVEAVFSPDKKELLEFLRENDLESDSVILIRREISASGKSRAFVNDSPVNLDLLRRLTALLVDMHQQFGELELGESAFQRQVLDALAGHSDLLLQYRTQYREWFAVQKELESHRDLQMQSRKEADYHQFLFDELDKAAFADQELETLEKELQLLANAESIKTALAKVYGNFTEGETPLVQQLKVAVGQLQPFAVYLPDLSALLQRLQAAQIELQDLTGELEKLNDHFGYDPSRMEQINERLSEGYKLLKKHAVRTTADLLQIQAGLQDRLQRLQDMDETIGILEKKTKKLLDQVGQLADQVSQNRLAQVGILEEKVNSLLQQVGMPNARLFVRLEPVGLNEFGKDAVEFLFDANKGNRPEPVRKVASGGELSRLMLCIKSLVAQSMDLPTLIFDEIDAGISGEAARQVGIILHTLSLQRQVICITHQPQIAAKADAHYFVYKESRGPGIRTNIRLLQKEERVSTIAQMLSGEKPTPAALENAREMVS